MFSHLTTSKKVSLSFSLFSFGLFFLFLIFFNVSYFLVWYQSQKQASFEDFDTSYTFVENDQITATSLDIFRSYILQKDILIIPEVWDPICSSSLIDKTDENIEKLQKRWYFQKDSQIYVVFSKYYPGVGQVKIFYDTTSYIHAQWIMFLLSLMFIVFFLIIQFFVGRYMMKSALKNLRKICDYCEHLNIENISELLIIDAPENDEIYIVWNTLSQMLEKIQKENARLQQFIADMAHEFKTPLMALSSKNDIMLLKSKKKPGLTQTENTQYLQYNKKYIKKLNAILEILFYLTRLWGTQEHTRNLHKKKMGIYIREFIDENFTEEKDMFHVLWNAEHTIEIEQFNMILKNLLWNALKYGNGNIVDIIIDRASIQVQDRWIGIRSEKIENIFESFYQEDTESAGFWVWLYLVKRLAELNSWKIEVFSEVWTGTTFTLYLK